jgi:hypothetical protein
MVILAKPGVVTAASTQLSLPAILNPAALGSDISYPQCQTGFPVNQTFGIVGVNGGIATNTNSCLGAELVWANLSTGITAQEKIQLYANTGNPGGLNTPSWPHTGSTPYGTCDHSNSTACAYRYGWNRAQADATSRGIIDPASYRWWLDIEILNSWDSSNGAQARNLADLTGMTDYFHSIGARVGLYSAPDQFQQIAGSLPASSSLNGLPDWIAGASSYKEALAGCAQSPLTPNGCIVLTQFTRDNTDYNISCLTTRKY